MAPRREVAAVIQIDYVDTHPHRQVVSAVVEHSDGKRYRLGHLPGEQWFCTCSQGRACRQIAAVQILVPRIPATPRGGGTK
jgi:hypothetical protein